MNVALEETSVNGSNGYDANGRRTSFINQIKREFSDREVESQKVVQKLHRILQKPPETRTASDIDILYEWVVQNGSTIKIFQGAQEIICKTICREMTLLELPAKGIVCHQGDYGDIFFIIIAGSVSLYMDTKRKIRINMDNTERRSDPYRQYQPPVQGEADEDYDEDTKLKSYGSLIKQIGAGGTFGELAVMDPTVRRSCTIICDIATSFICLKRGAYQRLIRTTTSSQLDFTQVEFLETLCFFTQWPHSELTRVSNRLRHVTFAANTYLTRVGSEANVVYFIYSGMVQESIPLINHLNENGKVHKTTMENDSVRVSQQHTIHNGETNILMNHPRKSQRLQRRVALELNIYQDHDICGEYPIFYHKSFSTTDLLAMTDVKTLVMDREMWKDIFLMQGLDHINEAHHSFRKLALARENWRQTRIKLALANPNLHLTITTKQMMQDGKCMCGWCGSEAHITGDVGCHVLLASKQKQADNQKKNADTAKFQGVARKKVAEINSKAHIVKHTLNFVTQLAEHATQRREAHANAEDSSTETENSQSTKRSPRHSRLKNVAHRILTTRETAGRSQTETAELTPSRPTIQQESGNIKKMHPPMETTQLEPISTSQPAVRPSWNKNVPPAISLPHSMPEEHAVDSSTHPNQIPSIVKVEEIRKGAFTEQVVSQYRQEMLNKMKKVVNSQQYYDVRSDVLQTISDQDRLDSETRYEIKAEHIIRKPKIPKPNRRLAMCSKTREPRPDRFNRKINRMLIKMWKKDHPIPKVEESLKD